jgi:hypothetical protein
VRDEQYFFPENFKIKKASFWVDSFRAEQQAVLPDDLFSDQKSQLGLILHVLAMEDDGTFYDHLFEFATIWYILWPIGIFYGHLVFFSRFGVFY